MLKLYLSLSFKYIKRHKLRSALAFCSIVFGVALILSTTVMSRGIIDSYQNMINTLAGKSQVIARSENEAFSAGYLEKVKGAEGVKDAIPSLQNFARLVQGNQSSSLYLIGIDPAVDNRVREYKFKEGQMPSGRDKSIIITNFLAERFKYQIGDEITLITAKGPVTFKLAGILNDTGISRANGGAFAAIDIKTAQELFDLQGKYNLIDFTLDDDYKADKVINSVKKASGGKLIVEQPAQRSQEVENMASSIKFQVNFTSYFALFVSVFLILNTIMVSVKERRKEIGTLRALGLTRGQISRLFLVESGLTGFAGSILGIALGIGALGYMKDSAIQLFKLFVRLDAVNFNVGWEDIFFCLLVGTGAALLASILPAREGAATPPVEAMRGHVESAAGKSYLARFLVGLAMVGCSLLILRPPIKSQLQTVFIFIFLIGMTLMIPAIIKWGARLLSWLLTKAFGPFGRLAGDNLVKSTQRTAITVASLMIGVTLVIGMGGNAASTRKSIDYFLSQGLVGDLMVMSANEMFRSSADVPLNYDFKAELQKIPGVKQVDVNRDVPYKWKENQIRIIALEGQFDRTVLAKGDRDNIKQRTAKGDGVTISETFEKLNGIHMGDHLTLNTPTGEKTFEVVGVTVDYTSMKGSILMSYGQFSKLWEDKKADGFNILIQKGYDAKKIKQMILDKYGQSYQITVRTNSDFKKEVYQIIDDTNKLLNLLEFMTMVVAFMGVFNTLVISVLERTREIGILRAIGTLRKEIRRMILLESGLIGIFGAFWGALAGSYCSYIIVQINRDMNGFSLLYEHPWALIFNLIIVSIVIALIAGFYPSIRAGKMQVVSAIQYE